VSGINPQPGPVVSGTGTGLNTQLESPLLVVKQREAITQINQQRFHDETLQWFGEECVVRLLWRAEDAAAGLVGYCQQCQDSPNPSTPTASGISNIQNRVSTVYRQTGNSYCPTCYGTTFSGGFQPTCYHLYMLASDTEDARINLSTGQFWKQNPRVQFSWFPQIRTGDLVVRVESWSNGSPTSTSERFQVSSVNPQTIRTGPGPSAQYPYRVGTTQPFSNTTIIVNQQTNLENVWPGHPYYNVPII
jgi:hypothetical protein